MKDGDGRVEGGGDAKLRQVTTSTSHAWPKARASDGRLRLSYGPIDLVFDLAGDAAEVGAAEDAARLAFDGLLEALVAELPLLRAAVSGASPDPVGAVARRMMAAVRPFAPEFVTPMAAVAGAVADQMLARIRTAAVLRRAVINNGGDIAIHLSGAERYRIGIHDHRHFHGFAGVVEMGAADGIGGIATSGWRGRSHSLGIADAVTVLADSGAEADVAATLIANAVDLPGASQIRRRPACELSPDSDLGRRLVTVDVGALSVDQVDAALARGAARAETYLARGLIRAAFLVLDGRGRSVGEARFKAIEKGGEK